MKLSVSPPNESNALHHDITSMGRSWLLPPMPSTYGSTSPTTYRGTNISIVFVRNEDRQHHRLITEEPLVLSIKDKCYKTLVKPKVEYAFTGCDPHTKNKSSAKKSSYARD